MAKVKGGTVSLSGKLGDKVFVKGRKDNEHVRHAPRKKLSKKVMEVLGKNARRTKQLNLLASEVNNIIHAYCGSFKSVRFYQSLQSHFRREPSDNRFMLLRRLKEMDVNPRYPFYSLGFCTIQVKGLKDKVVVNLKIATHSEGRPKSDCYYYEVILLTWNKKSHRARHSLQCTDWLKSKGRKAEFDFEFARPAGTAQWLLCLRQRLGLHEEEIESFHGESMQIHSAGTFDKEDEEILKKRMEEKEKEREKSRLKKEEDTRVRIKPKGWND